MTQPPPSTEAHAAAEGTPDGAPERAGGGRGTSCLQGTIVAAVVALPVTLLGVVLLLMVAAGVLLQTPEGRETLARTIERLASTPGGTDVTLGTIGPGLPSRLQVDRIGVADADGAWLEVRDLVFAWQPADLLRGRVHVSEFALSALQVARLPAPRAETPPSGHAVALRLPHLPVAVTVDRLHLDEVLLDPSVLGQPGAGQPVRLAAKGEFAAARDAGRIHTALTVDRLNGGAGGLRLQADFDPATRELAVDAAFQEPPGGLVAGLLGLADRPALWLRLAGHGPLDDWHGTVAGEAKGIASVSAELALQAADGERLEAAGRIQIAGDPVPALHPALADGLRFQTALRRAPDETLAIEALSIESDGMRLVADAKLGPDGKTVVAKADLAVEERALARGTLGPIRFSSARTHLTATGRLDAPSVEAQAEITDIAGAGVRASRADVQAQAALSAGGVAGEAPEITATLDLHALQTQNRPLGAALGEEPTVTLTADLDRARSLLTLRELTLNGRVVQLIGQGTLGLDSGALSAEADLVLADLQPIGAAAGFPASGEVRLGAKVEGGLKPPALRGTVDAHAARLATGIAVADALLGQEPRLGAGFAFDAGAGTEVQRLRLDGRHVQAEGRAAVSAAADRFDSRLRVEIPSLAPLSAALGTPLRGSAVLDVSAEGNPADPSGALTLRLADAMAGSTRVADARIDARASTLVSRPAGRLDALADSDFGPLTASVEFTLDQNRVLRLAPMSAGAAGVRLTGDIEADLQGKIAAGQLHARSDTPETGVRLGDTKVVGPLLLDLRLTPTGGRQMVTANLRAGPLALLQSAQEQARLTSLSGEATVTDAFAAPAIAATLQATGVTAGTHRIHRIQATADGTSAELAVGLTASGEGASPDEVVVGATVAAAGDATRVDLDRLQGSLAGLPLRLQRPARFVSDGDRHELRDLVLTLGDGRIEAAGRLAPNETAADVRVTALPVALARMLSPSAPAAGTADLVVALRTERADTVGDATLRLRDVALAAGPGEARLDAVLDLRLGDRRLSAEGRIAGPQASTASLSAHLPMRLPAGQPAPDIDRQAPLDGRLEVAADVGKLTRLLALDDQRIEGRVDGDFTIGGTLAQPDLQGGLTLAHGLYENFVTGTLLRDMTARLEPVDPRTIAVHLTGNDGGTGRVGADGSLGLDSEGKPLADLAITADRATLVRRDDVTATTNADLTYSTRNDPPRLAGRIETTEVIVRLVDRLPPSVIVMPVKEIGGRPGPRTASADGAPSIAIALGIDVALPRRVFVRGRGLESEWEGALSVTGTTAKPQISGNIGLVRGTFSFAGKRFDMQRGAITFTGGQPVDPLIDALAEYRASTITAQIRISGLASKPEITITSQPPLPESEVLAQVLFGKSSAKLGPVEAVQLAAAVDALARGESTSENAFDFVRTLLGLDTLSVQPSNTGGGSSVAVGRYVGDRVYIGAQQGIEDSSQTGSVEVEILPGISVESEIGQSATSGTQGALGLKWKLDY